MDNINYETKKIVLGDINRRSFDFGGCRAALVMMGLDGVLETAFPPKEPESYLANSMFIYVGLVKDLL